MKKGLIIFSMFLFTSPALAGGIVSKMSSSVQLNVDAAQTTATRIGNSYSVSGSGVNTTDGTTAGSVGGIGALTNGVGAMPAITATQATDGNAFSFTQSITAGDTAITSAPTVGEVSPFSNQVSLTAGSAGSLAGTVTTGGALTITAGGAGTSGIGQFVSEITAID